jgi:DNA-binding FadR family transcriptional regulator
MSRSGRQLPAGPAAGAGPVRAVPARAEVTPPALGSLLQPVRTGNAFEETVERLLTVIKLGVVAPGGRFPAERELASRLGISRATLREAMRELHQAGYVQSRRGRFGGTFVTYRPPAPSQAEAVRLTRENSERLADALTFRMAVETGAAEALARSLAAGRPTVRAAPRTASGEAARSAREVLLAALAAVNAAGPGDYRRLDTLFHLSIAELSGSSLLTAACADARMRLNDLLNAIPVLRRNIGHGARQHAAIATAILAGDPERARQAVAEHLEGTAALLRAFLAGPGATDPGDHY